MSKAIRRVLTLIALLAAALPLSVCSAIAADVPSAAVVYTYDGPNVPGAYTYTRNDREPPVGAVELHHQRADDRGSIDALARRDATITGTYYDASVQFVSVARSEFKQGVKATATTQGQIDATDGTISSPAPGVVAAKTGDDASELVYRVHGGDARQWGHSWTTDSPLKMGNPRSDLGLPKVNSGEYVTCARVCNTDGVIKRNALPLDGNPGGGPELLFPNPQQQLQHLWTIRAEPPL